MIYFAPLNSGDRVRDKLILCQDLVKTSGFVPIISIPVIKIYPPPKGIWITFAFLLTYGKLWVALTA